ncbi:MAG: hypothetical protein AAF191_15610, partial [Verrucomicrobiota bacterium]
MSSFRFLLLLFFCLVSGPTLQARTGLFQRTEPAPNERESIVLVQCYLDDVLLGPGKIDGRNGTFTKLAVELFNQSHRLDPDNWWRV